MRCTLDIGLLLTSVVQSMLLEWFCVLFIENGWMFSHRQNRIERQSSSIS